MLIGAKRSPGRPPLDESLTARRQEEILDAAAKIFAEFGYQNTDLQLVADKLGVAKGTLYRYFPSKKELFLAAADRVVRNLHHELDQVIAETGEDIDPFERMHRIIRTYFAFLDTHPEFVELLIQERAEFRDRGKPTYFQHREERLEPWQSRLRQLIKGGIVRDVPVDRLTDVMSNIVYGTIFTNYFAGRSKSLESQTNDVMDIIMHGILSQQERQKRDE